MYIVYKPRAFTLDAHNTNVRKVIESLWVVDRSHSFIVFIDVDNDNDNDDGNNNNNNNNSGRNSNLRKNEKMNNQ